ncbi:Protein of unknown function [Pyronema omphalodes CBS 100304]|uniref:Uncharacterized protein n=1 Tax=Pyronema omphalodes (strain CBS 100304) TaxID=1076935 RepID=U4KU32_PYROM|nr:Protein of unknown function [Pyronema omphalodes CBS 100304]
MLPYKDPYEGDVDSEYGSQSCACTITRRFNFTGLHWFSLVFTGFRKLIQPKPSGDTQPPPVTISLRMLCHTGATTNQSLRASMIPVVKLHTSVTIRYLTERYSIDISSMQTQGLFSV